MSQILISLMLLFLTLNADIEMQFSEKNTFWDPTILMIGSEVRDFDRRM